jgi:guanylate cyclase
MIPKRLDVDVKNRMEDFICSSVNQKEELSILSKRLIKMVNNNEKLLEEIFPSRIVKRLLNKETIEPEKFDFATIFFSDIVGFTNICLEKKPIEVFLLLNKLYTLMDSIAAIFSVYKVETIVSLSLL